MQNNVPQMSEKELADRIIHMHDHLNLGYRRIAEELRRDGHRTNKDKVNQLYQKVIANEGKEQREEKALTLLRAAEKRARQRVEIQKEKEHILRQLTAFFVEERTATFAQRRALFDDKDRILRFARRVMPIVDPMLWHEFTEFCEERGYDSADAVAISLGDQRDFELELANHSANFDTYLRRKLSEYLTGLREQEHREEKSEATDPEPGADEEATELVTIELPDDFYWQ